MVIKHVFKDITSMNTIKSLIKVTEILDPAVGWICWKITNTKIFMRHPTLGDRVCLCNGGRVHIRGEQVTKVYGDKK